MYHYWDGFAWTDPVDIPIDELREGPHIVEVTLVDQQSASFRIPLLIRRHWKPVVVVASTNTWHAYNDFGGLSNYRTDAVPWPLRPIFLAAKAFNLRLHLSDRFVAPSVPLPLRRPLINIDEDLRNETGSVHPTSISHLYRGELNLCRALDRLGVDYALADDEDLDRGSILEAHPRLVIFNTHSEYWTRPAIALLRLLMDHGANVAFFSGNNIFRLVERRGLSIQVVDQRIDPDLPGALIGAGYDALGYMTFAGFRFTAAEHWALEGVRNLAPHGTFGQGDGTQEQPGSSGLETDKPRISTEGFQILAIGENSEGPAYIMCRDLANGGYVFNVASVAFTSIIDTDDAALQLLRNVVRRAGCLDQSGSNGRDAKSRRRPPLGLQSLQAGVLLPDAHVTK
jgi:hypothetical protein